MPGYTMQVDEQHGMSPTGDGGWGLRPDRNTVVWLYPPGEAGELGRLVVRQGDEEVYVELDAEQQYQLGAWLTMWGLTHGFPEPDDG